MFNTWYKLPTAVVIDGKLINFDKVHICQLHNQHRITDEGLYQFPCSGWYYGYYDGKSWYENDLENEGRFIFERKDLPKEWVFEPIVSKDYAIS